MQDKSIGFMFARWKRLVFSHEMEAEKRRATLNDMALGHSQAHEAARAWNLAVLPTENHSLFLSKKAWESKLRTLRRFTRDYEDFLQR